MNWFNDIKIGSKLLLVFGILVSSMIAFAIFAIVEITSIGRNNSEVINSYQARQIHIANAIIESYRMRYANLSRGYVTESENAANMVAKIMEDYEKSASTFMENLIGFRDITSADPKITESERRQRLAAVNGIEDSFIRYMQIAGKIQSTVEGLNRDEVFRVLEEAIPYGNDLSEKLEELSDLTFFTTRRKVMETTENTAQIINLILLITTAFLFLAAFALLLTVNNINRPITNLEKGVIEIANGNLAFPIRSNRRDELGVLSNSIGDMVDKISEHSKTMTIMDNMDAMICVSDLDHNLLYVNKRLADRFGMDIKTYTNQKCYKATRGKESPCLFCQLSELLPLKEIYPSKDFEYIWDDSLGVWLGGTASIIRWVDGSMVLFQASRDVTQKKRQEELLRDALEEAKTASVAKSSFLANMSHEIRTPMNAILGIAEIELQDDDLKSKTRESLEKIHQSGDHLLSIINEILDLSKIEAGKLELVRAEYKMASMINDTVTLNMMRIGSKPIEFVLSVDENIPLTLYGDELRIKQILNNLLSNSFKYTKRGMVKLAISCETGNAGTLLIFTVSDTGQGMSEEQVSKLFDEYSRFNMEANRYTEGTGLGMSITKNLIRMMNGTIHVKSEVNWGSVFTVSIPQMATDSGILGKKLAKNLEQFQSNGEKQLKRSQVVFEPMAYGKVLIVDDVESNLYVAKGLMSPYGLSIETVTSGFEAIDRIKAGNMYDIVFMDHMMPEMDGIETTKKIRGIGYTQPVVALTANAVVGQSEVFLENGFDGFISKPIDVRQLNAMLKKFVRDKQPPKVIEDAVLSAEKLRQPQAANGTAETAAQLSIDPELAEIFVRDARKSLAALETIGKKNGAFDDEDMQIFTVNAHGMKSALANVGETDLSAAALRLEQAGKAKDTALIAAETQAFLDDLRAVTEKLAPQKESGGRADDEPEGARAYLCKKLTIVKESCEKHNEKTAKETISELMEKAWPRMTKDMLGTMAEHISNGNFDEVIRLAQKIIG
ncbi:MAG: ATP-binding protein [Treponema sp.]|nr:ATP-binding protein [Treponema sp.]